MAAFVLMWMIIPVAQAQDSVDCDTPKRIKWKGTSAVSVEAGKQECDKAKRLIDISNDLFKEAKEYREVAERQRSRAEEIKGDAKNRRDEAKKRNKELDGLPKRFKDQEKRHGDRLDALSGSGERLGAEVTFILADAETSESPSFNGYTWPEAKNSSMDAMNAYEETSKTMQEVELAMAEEMVLFFEEEAAIFERNAEMREKRASELTVAAAAAEQAAEQFAAAAHVREQSAILHTVSGAMSFVEEHGEGGGKEVERAVKYVELYMSKLPQEVALHAQQIIAGAR